MSLIQINGGTQIQLASITDDRLATPYIKADGTRPFAADQSLNGFRITDLADPQIGTDAVTRQYLHGVLLDTYGAGTAIGKGLMSADTKAAARTVIDAENSAAKGQPYGYAALDGTGKIPPAQIPAPETFGITKTDVGLGQVDNTSDATKWAATATISNKTLDATNEVTVRANRFTLWDANNSAKRGQFSLANVSPLAPQVYVLPPTSTTLAGTDSIQVITNKTISGDLNTFSDIPQAAVVDLGNALAARELLVHKGQADGYVPLNSAGKIDAGYLPSFVDDVVEFDTKALFPTVGERGKIYTALDTQAIYRWTGSVYILLGGDPDLVPGNYAETIGDGTSTTFVLQHNFHTLDVLIGVWEIATGREVNCDKSRTTVNTCALTFLTPPAVNQYRAVLLNGGVLAERVASSAVSTWSTTTLTGSGTLASAVDFTYVILLAANAAPTLPTAVGNTSRYFLKNIETTNKTVTTTGGQTIEGQPNMVLSPGASAQVISDGTNWRII